MRSRFGADVRGSSKMRKKGVPLMTCCSEARIGWFLLLFNLRARFTTESRIPFLGLLVRSRVGVCAFPVFLINLALRARKTYAPLLLQSPASS